MKALLAKWVKRQNQDNVGGEWMSKAAKKGAKAWNWQRKKINGRLQLVMEERNENEKMNREWQGMIERPKMGRTWAKGKNIDMKILMEPEDKREKMEWHKHKCKKERKTNKYKVGEEQMTIRMAKKWAKMSKTDVEKR